MIFDGIDVFDAMYDRMIEEYEMRAEAEGLMTFEMAVKELTDIQIAHLENCYRGALDIITERHMLEHYNRALTRLSYVMGETDTRAMIREYF